MDNISLQSLMQLLLRTVLSNASSVAAMAEVYKDKDFSTFSSIYNTFLIRMPRIVCKDGFSISIQAGNCHYASSDKGYRVWGTKFEDVEWGYPSLPIDGVKYKDEMCSFNEEGDYSNAHTVNSVGCCSIDTLQELLDEHGGIDITLTSEFYKNKLIANRIDDGENPRINN